jgi:hypothetical protein
MYLSPSCHPKWSPKAVPSRMATNQWALVHVSTHVKPMWYITWWVGHPTIFFVGSWFDLFSLFPSMPLRNAYTRPPPSPLHHHTPPRPTPPFFFFSPTTLTKWKHTHLACFFFPPPTQHYWPKWNHIYSKKRRMRQPRDFMMIMIFL